MSRRTSTILVFTVTSLILASSCKPEEPPCTDCPVYDPTPVTLERPLGMPAVPNTAGNMSLTGEGIELGRFLFFDPILSGDSTQSCSSCHQLAFGLTDQGRRFSVGIDGIEGSRNAMPLFNLAYTPAFGLTYEGRSFGGFFWDSRAESVEDQALLPIQDPIEMHNTLPEVVHRLRNHEVYPRMFFEAFGDSTVTPERIGDAIGQFERTILSGNTPFDVQQATFFTDDDVVDGLTVFLDVNGGDCFHCHGQGTGAFTDYTYRNNGLDSASRYTDFEDPGLGAITGDTLDYGKFKVPSLRNLALTAPYMHDGRFETLEEVIDFYSEGVHPGPFTDPLMEFADQGGVQLDEEEKRVLIAFLESLTDTAMMHNPRYQNPFEE